MKRFVLCFVCVLLLTSPLATATVNMDPVLLCNPSVMIPPMPNFGGLGSGDFAPRGFGLSDSVLNSHINSIMMINQLGPIMMEICKSIDQEDLVRIREFEED